MDTTPWPPRDPAGEAAAPADSDLVHCVVCGAPALADRAETLPELGVDGAPRYRCVRCAGGASGALPEAPGVCESPAGAAAPARQRLRPRRWSNPTNRVPERPSRAGRLALAFLVVGGVLTAALFVALLVFTWTVAQVMRSHN